MMNVAGITETKMRARAAESLYRKALRRLLRQHLAIVGGIFLVAVIAAAIFAPLVAPHDPEEVFWDAIRSPPSSEYWLGTDGIGRDILSRLIFGARVSLEIVFGSIAISLTIGSA